MPETYRDETCVVHHGCCLDVLRSMPDKSVDLCFTSPPYEAARKYGIDFKLKNQAWVDWCVPRFLECLRVTRGIVCWVVEGQTRQFRWSATPALLMADLHRAGVHLRKPPVFHRVGIPGSGGPDWLRNDWEAIVVGGPKGKLPWSDNCAIGKPCKWMPGGKMSNRYQDGRRINQQLADRRSFADKVKDGAKVHTKNDGKKMRKQAYLPPTLANPGNVFRITVGGGRMGSDLAHESEAPFPLALADIFVRSFCPPGGIAIDPFCGSGTVAQAAILTGRGFVGIDIRESQCDLTRRRILEARGQLVS